MLRKLFILIVCILILQIQTIAEDSTEKNNSSIWGGDTDVFNSGFEDQEAVTDTKMHKIINQLKERNLTRKQRKIQKEVNPLSPSVDMQHLQDFTQNQDPDNELSQTLTVMIPVKAYSEDGIYIAPGYYKLSCHKVAENEYELELSQGTKKILRVKAQQTEQDLEQETIQFCNAEIIDGDRIRLMYGSIDLNLVGYLYFN